MEKTEEESVEDIMAANNNDVNKPMLADFIVMPNTHQVMMPVMEAVNSTPTEASTMPCGIIGRIYDILVFIPPEKRIIHQDMVPIALAM